MPSLRAISTWRSAQEEKAISAQIVMSCHSPPSRNGAQARPRLMGGGLMLILNSAQVGPIAAP